MTLLGWGLSQAIDTGALGGANDKMPEIWSLIFRILGGCKINDEKPSF
ncbi:hypothetical protein [Olsenella massiliensis]|nr:hypothetical protein [Olsenella massiliensis]